MKKLFNATFEQSLNLEDDKLIKYMQKDVERPDVKEKPILLKVLAVVTYYTATTNISIQRNIENGKVKRN
ncbi:hypothetical protein ACFJYJ_13230 [Enterococcus faecalis]|nr:hypothetical protein [Enterococcus faecalis]EHZ5160156.1 hypothetical protein [Enterococcus faecalis]EKZ0210736.1 hypothetical protein [Enterococcus faecalis]ELS0455785.1 hypothetical protein [Enterococcus faecalis]NSU83671.1 hypothetical protein [Enterococcus faecalis]